MPRAFAALLFSAIVAGVPTVSPAQRYCRPCKPVPRQYCPPDYQHSTPQTPEHSAPAQPGQSAPAPDRDQPAPEPAVDGSQQSQQQQPQAPNQFQQVQPPQQTQQTQPTFNRSQPTTAATSAQSLAPNAIGDFFGTGGSQFELLGSPYVGPNAAAAGGNVGRQKIGENVSAIPRDRVFVNYSYFDQVPLSARGTNINRFTPGFEKTFLDGDMSFEFRAPFASTANSTFLSNGNVEQSELEMGDLVFFLKGLLYDTNEIAISGGVGFSFPTHDPFRVEDVNTGATLIKVDNNAIHALPFLAALWTPNDQLFVQGFAQIDTDLNGNTVFVDNAGLVDAGRIQDQTYLFLDVIAGYWVYQNPCGRIRGIAPMIEFHYNRSLDDADAVAFGNTGVSGGEDDLSLLNSVLGVTIYTSNDVQIIAGYGFPLGSADDQFDGEIRLAVNWLFGPNRARLFSGLSR